MTNREAHEEAAGYGLEERFFAEQKIDPDAEYVCPAVQRRWQHIDMSIPSEGQNVWYYFGFFDRVYAGNHKSFSEEGYPPGVVSNCFHGKGGFLTDDVTFWMPREFGDSKPLKPSRDQLRHEVYHRLEALNGGCDRYCDIRRWCRA